jgi:hypothetical protein
LHLLNGDTVETKVRDGGAIKRMLEAGRTPEQVLETIYIRCLARKPAAAETEKLLALVAAEPVPQKGLEDVFWAVLNSREFLFNH